MNEIKIDNYKLNYSYFENLEVVIKMSSKEAAEQLHNIYAIPELIENICKLTSELDKYNMVYDLNEHFISDDKYFVSAVDFMKYSYQVFNSEFLERRLLKLNELFFDVKFKIQKALEKRKEINNESKC